jgi:hypothetical protein
VGETEEASSMMIRQSEKLGVKQTIQKHWMDMTVNMLLAGMSEQMIRTELDQYLMTQKQSGGIGERGLKTYPMAISMLSCWFSPNNDLVEFRDNALALARASSSDEWLPLHWAIMSAAYPFWFEVAKQVGRLLNLQEKVTQVQVFNRVKERYGDRETVARNARYAVRSQVAWGVLCDTTSKGSYCRNAPKSIDNKGAGMLLIESALRASRGTSASFSTLINSPAFYPFILPEISGDFIATNNERISLNRYGSEDQLLTLHPTRTPNE